MNFDTIGGAVRTILATLGGIAVGAGVVSQTDAAEIIKNSGDLITAGGVIASALVGIWSVIQKLRQRKS